MHAETADWTGRWREGSTVLRSLILILTSLLIGMGAGGLMPRQTAIMCMMIGFYGLVAYLALVLTAHYRARRERVIRQAISEERAERRLQLETGLLGPGNSDDRRCQSTKSCESQPAGVP